MVLSKGVGMIQWGPIEYERLFTKGLQSCTHGLVSFVPGHEKHADMEYINSLCNVLSTVQQKDMLQLMIDGYVILLDESGQYPNVWRYLLTRTPKQFMLYYKLISKKRELAKGVKEILENHP